MTADINFDGFKTVKPSSLKWNRSIHNYSDTATIVLPAMCTLVDKDKNYSIVATGQKIIEGTKVEIMAGYDGENDLQFKGFVKRINFKVPVEIECEGYSYPLRRKVIEEKKFGVTTMKAVMGFLLQDTGITISAKTLDIEFRPVTFTNMTVTQVFDWIKENYSVSIFFFYDELYVGLSSTYKGEVVRHRLNWNIINDGDLLFQTYTGSIVHIQGEGGRDKAGPRKKRKSGNNPKPGDVKIIKTLITNEQDLQMVVDDLQLKENQKGYSGTLTGFLKPFVTPGMTTEIIDTKYTARNGSYFIDAVAGSFGPGGGRQKISIAFKL